VLSLQFFLFVCDARLIFALYFCQTHRRQEKDETKLFSGNFQEREKQNFSSFATPLDFLSESTEAP